MKLSLWYMQHKRHSTKTSRFVCTCVTRWTHWSDVLKHDRTTCSSLYARHFRGTYRTAQPAPSLPRSIERHFNCTSLNSQLRLYPFRTSNFVWNNCALKAVHLQAFVLHHVYAMLYGRRWRESTRVDGTVQSTSSSQSLQPVQSRSVELACRCQLEASTSTLQAPTQCSPKTRRHVTIASLAITYETLYVGDWRFTRSCCILNSCSFPFWCTFNCCLIVATTRLLWSLVCFTNISWYACSLPSFSRL